MDALPSEACSQRHEALDGLIRVGQEKVVVLNVEDANALMVVELCHLGYYAPHTAYAEFFAAAAQVPGIDATEGAVPPTTPTGEQAGDWFVVIGVECGALRKGQDVQIIR